MSAQLFDPRVRGFILCPANANGNGIVVTHGAGSNAQSPLLIALSEAFAGAGFTVLRYVPAGEGARAAAAGRCG